MQRRPGGRGRVAAEGGQGAAFVRAGLAQRRRGPGDHARAALVAMETARPTSARRQPTSRPRK